MLVCFALLIRCLQGCSAPIVVKLADSPKERERKKVQAQISQQLSQFTNQWKSLSSLAAFAPVSIMFELTLYDKN